MAKKTKKGGARRTEPKPSPLPAPSLAPQVLEQAAQGWLQLSGTTAPYPRSSSRLSDQRLTEAMTETLREIRAELTELRTRLERLEGR